MLIILNELSCFIDSRGLTCFLHNGRASTIEYVITSIALILSFAHYNISNHPAPLTNHFVLSVTLVATTPHTPPPLFSTFSPCNIINFNYHYSITYTNHLHQILSRTPSLSTVIDHSIFFSKGTLDSYFGLLSSFHTIPSLSMSLELFAHKYWVQLQM